MEENNTNIPPAQEPAAAPQSSPQPPAPEQKETKTTFWLKAVAVLYGLSLAAAFVLITKTDAARKAKGGDMDISKLTTLVQSSKDAVAVVTINGVITQSNAARSWERGPQQISRRIKKLAEKKEVKAIVLDINTPGGSVGSVQEIHSAILRAKAASKKPFIARFADVSASGGYYIAAACDKIVAHPGTITGSIGVIFSVSNLEGLMKKVGYKSDAIKSGKFKDIGSATREMTSEERRLLQSMIDDSYSQFLAAVVEGRKMPEARVKELADGRIFTGRQAQEAGLVDKLGDLQDALDLAGEMAKLGKNPRILRDSDPFENLMSMMEAKLSWPGGEAIGAALEGPRLEYRWDGR